ncbi:MAG: sugar kinase [Saprospiraceae bacterium]
MAEEIAFWGEILLRLSPPDRKRLRQAYTFEAYYGGSEANVAVSLAQWNLKTRFITRLPDNNLGQAALDAVARYGVGIGHALRGGKRIGLYFLESGHGRRGGCVLYDRDDSGMATVQASMLNAARLLEGVAHLHWSGITPALSHTAAEATLALLRAARERGISVSCDLNLRKNLWQYGRRPIEVMPELVTLTDILIGDRSAIRICLGVEAPGSDTAFLLQKTQDAYPNLQTIAATSREGFSASHNAYQGMLLHDGGFWSSQRHDLPDILERIGAGDAFAAGLLYGIRQGWDAQRLIEFATAAGAFKHYVAGDANIATQAEIMALAEGDSGAKVKR